MSSQDSGGVTVAHALNGVGYKLLELPPELLALLEESAEPPVLTLHPASNSALLKTPPSTSAPEGTTYSLRQKNTSNGLMLLEPALPDAASTGEEEGIPTTALEMRIVAAVHETIELVAEASHGKAAAAAPSAPGRGKWHERFKRDR